MDALEPWFALRAVPGLSDSTLVKLVRCFGSPENVFQASISELTQASGISSSLASAIRTGPDFHSHKKIRQELDRIRTEHWSVITVLDAHYPSRLSLIPDPPSLLYVQGTFCPEDHFALAIVGARRASPGGMAFTQELSGNLAALGFTIVSGLARGIDAAAHQGALTARGRTLAVLGCGLDRTYPPEHRTLRGQIQQQGVVLSELSLGAPPLPYHFPRRNRIISGLSLGVIVAEANLKSGSLITARFALEHNREVFAVPGSVKSTRHQGPHSLIKQGAKLVESCDDVLEEVLPQLDGSFQDRVINARLPRPLTPPAVSTQEQDVYNVIGEDAISVDEILTQAPFLPAEVMSILLSLELKGLVKQEPGSLYVRI